MIPKEKMDECVARFTQNPYWRAYLDNAPESAKEYIRMDFAFSLPGEENRNDEEFKAAMNKSRKKLPADALKYLYENERNMTAKSIYTKMEDADWDFLIKHTRSYARGMPIAMARRHYQHKDIRGNPIEE